MAINEVMFCVIEIKCPESDEVRYFCTIGARSWCNKDGREKKMDVNHDIAQLGSIWFRYIEQWQQRMRKRK